MKKRTSMCCRMGFYEGKAPRFQLMNGLTNERVYGPKIKEKLLELLNK